MLTNNSELLYKNHDIPITQNKMRKLVKGKQYSLNEIEKLQEMADITMNLNNI